MKFYRSTRSLAETATATEAIFRGIAPDGGLYTPTSFADMQVSMDEFLGRSALELAQLTLGRLLGEFSAEEIRGVVEKGYEGKFETEDLVPLKDVGDAHVLELFRGPTSAFKDMALSLLPRLMALSRKKLGADEEILVLTATSGDTGKAALEGFCGVPGTRIIVFYPENGVSDVQRAQMVTQPGENVAVCAVRGNFDDAQTGVKRIFADDGREGWAAKSGVCLSSANSINLGRLAPQVFYYFKAYADLVARGAIRPGDAVNFAVPTGNFGDILAGEFARRMGLPVGRLICASNANNVLTDFIRTGVYDRRRDFHKTMSPSMDILVSSNLERYLFLAGGCDPEPVKRMMAELSEKGAYQAPESVMARMRETFWGGWADDAQAAGTIRREYGENGYLMDPHTAVGRSALTQYRAETGDNRPAVVLSTASPYKFPAAVLDALGFPAERSGFAAMDELHARTGAPIPKNLAALRDLPVRHTDCVDRTEMLEYVREKAKR